MRSRRKRKLNEDSNGTPAVSGSVALTVPTDRVLASAAAAAAAAAVVEAVVVPEQTAAEAEAAAEAAEAAAEAADAETTGLSDLFFELDKHIARGELVELHTHVMGMGSADFWVNRIMKVYLRNKINNDRARHEVYYPVEIVWAASGLSYPCAVGPNYRDKSWQLAILESKLLDAQTSSAVAKDIFVERKIEDKEKKMVPTECISHSKLLELMEGDSSGAVQAMVRNWFEFLDVNGKEPSYADILQTYRGRFTPEFDQRFKIRDIIVSKHPEVLSILLNNALARYAKAGVKYVEFSLSAGDLLDVTKRAAVTDEVFTVKFDGSEAAAPVPASDAAGKKPSSNRRRSQPSKTQLPEGERSFVLPSVQQSIEKPKWRKFLNDYNDKWREQSWSFLAAFNRAKNFNVSGLNLELTTLAASSSSSAASSAEASEHYVVDHLLHFIGEDHSDAYLEGRALYAIQDSIIAAMYPKELEKIINFLEKYLKSFSEKKSSSLAGCVSGIDWVADEFGHPFCAFTHSDVLDKLKKCRQLNPNFGVRIHAGEGLIRYSSYNAETQRNSSVGKLFRFHLFVLMRSIETIFNGLNDNPRLSSGGFSKCNIRIGHGIAFLFDEPDTPLGKELTKFRSFLRTNNIPCELNPTSNHMLIPASFEKQEIRNNHTLTAFLQAKLPVVLCTDDDGIWSIHKCASHYHHVSVAHEFCDAIERKEIKSIYRLNKLIADGRKYSFANENEKNEK